MMPQTRYANSDPKIISGKGKHELNHILILNGRYLLAVAPIAPHDRIIKFTLESTDWAAPPKDIEIFSPPVIMYSLNQRLMACALIHVYAEIIDDKKKPAKVGLQASWV